MGIVVRAKRSVSAYKHCRP